MAHKSLRDRQVASIYKILNLNHEPPTSTNDDHANGLLPESLPIIEDGEPIWKVLVFDNFGRDIISSILRVSDLRSAGITIHLSLNSTRHMIPEVPAIYFIEPTAANLEIVVSDLTKGLYSLVYLNFTSSIPRQLLEDFAAQVATANVSDKIAQLYDQYLNFITSEKDLFSLGMGKDVYYLMNSSKTTDQALDASVDRIVSGLFSVCVTMGSIPIIRCPKGGAAEFIAPKLDRKLRDHILSSKENNLFSGSHSSRPLLVICDRTIDITPMLSHSWVYQSLVSDVLDMRLNQITVEVPDDTGAKPVRKNYDLKANDIFWEKNAPRPFPTVAEEIDKSLSAYREEAAEITKKAGANSLEDLQADTGASAAQLKTAITLLPELRERKAILDMHMTILTALLTQIKNRQLDEFFALEESILARKPMTKLELLDVINAKDKGNESLDKLRLFIIWYLSADSELSRPDFESFKKALASAGCEVSSLNYVQQLRSLTRMTMMSSAPTSEPTQASMSTDLFSAISSRLTSGLKEAGIGANFDTLVSGVKNLLPVSKDLTLTQIAHSMMSPSEASSAAIAKTENYLYFDPRSANARGTMPAASAARGQQASSSGYKGLDASFGQKRQGFSEAIVFTVGGGSIDEFVNLKEFEKRSSASGPPGSTPRFKITYGSTEILSARDFIKAMERLGDESS